VACWCAEVYNRTWVKLDSFDQSPANKMSLVDLTTPIVVQVDAVLVKWTLKCPVLVPNSLRTDSAQIIGKRTGFVAYKRKSTGYSQETSLLCTHRASPNQTTRSDMVSTTFV